MSYDARARSGLLVILAATAIAGVLGYAVQLVAGIVLVDPSQYVAFASYWSLLYLIVSAMSGVQQEVTRATRLRVGEAHSPRRQLRVYIVVLLLGLIATTVVVIAIRYSGGGVNEAFSAGIALFVGGAGYLVVAILSGIFYGLSHWRAAAAMTAVDAVIRAALVVAALILGADRWVIEMLVSVPFFLAFGLVWLWFGHPLAHRFSIDVAPFVLLRNTLHTLAASAAMGVMITGMPLVLQSALPHEPARVTAAIVFATTLTRAPIVVPLQALQSFFVSRLRDADGVRRSVLTMTLAGSAAIAAVLGLVAAWVGPPILGAITSGRYEASGVVVAILVVGAVLVGVLTVTGAALLGSGRHRLYSAGWVVAAVSTVGLALLPLPLELKLAAAMVVAPTMGIAVHVVALLRSGAAEAQGPAPSVQ